MRPRRIRHVALGAAVLLAAVLAFLATRPVEQGAIFVPSPLIGTSAPNLVANTLSGTRVSLQSLRGRVVVLSFFASWCTPCRDEAPNLVALAWRTRSASARTVVLGVVFNDSGVAAGNFARTVGITYPILTDPTGSIANDFGVVALPVTVVIDARGHVAAMLQGTATTTQLLSATAAARRTAA